MLLAMDGPVTDRELMMRYGAGDADSFAQLYTRHKGPLFRYFKRQCRHNEQAEELFQETWTRVIKAREKYQATAKFTTWLYRIAHNLLMDYGRKVTRQPHLVAVNNDEEDVAIKDQAASPSELADAASLGDRLIVALNNLPNDQRETFLLKEESGLSLLEIAEVLGVGRETVKSRLRYAVQKLRHTLEDDKEALT